MSAYQVGHAVLEKAKDLGLGGELEAEIESMARLSVPFSLGKMNRRFEGWLFSVKDSIVIDIDRFDPNKPLPRMDYPQEDFRRKERNRPRHSREEMANLYVDAINCTKCRGTKMVSQTEECEICLGRGCHSCQNTGSVKRLIPCQFYFEPRNGVCDQGGSDDV